MKNKKFDKMSNGKLLEQEKSIKVLTGLLAGVLIVLFVLGVFLSTKQGLYSFLIIPFALFPIVILNFNALKEIRKELNTRENIG